MPATTTWTGLTSTAFGTSANWTNGVPAAGDDVIIAPRLVFVAATELEPAHWQSISVNCVGMHAAASAYASVTIVSTYTGTVTLYGGFTTADLTLQGGTLDQPTATSPYSLTNITVTGDFVWTGGTLNSTNHLATLTVSGEGATALFAPMNGGTVYCGSNITLEDGAVATMEEGETEVTNDDWELNIEAGCSMDVDPGTGLTAGFRIPYNVLRSTHINLKPSASLTVESGIFRAAGWMTNEGTFTLMPGTQAYFPGVEGVDQAYLQQNGPSGSASTLLYGGSLIETELSKDVKITGGIFVTVSDDGYGYGSGDCSATIQTHTLEITGGDLAMNYGAAAHTSFGTLTVIGNVSWTGGTYRPFVQDGTTNADLWDIVGTLTVGGTATLGPAAIDGEWIHCLPTSNSSWLCFQTTGGITANNNPPVVWEVANVWIIEPIDDPVTKWKVKAL